MAVFWDYSEGDQGIADTVKKVTEIIPRLKDGGAFVKFSHPPDMVL